MNLVRPILCCCCLILTLTQNLSAESWRISAYVDSVRKFDEYGNIPFRDEKARLDNLAFYMLRDEPNFIAYIVAYGGRRSCRNEAQLRANRAKNYLVSRRGISAERVIIIDGGYREELTVELFVFPREADAPYAAATVHPSEAQILGDCSVRNSNRRRRGGR